MFLYKITLCTLALCTAAFGFGQTIENGDFSDLEPGYRYFNVFVDGDAPHWYASHGTPQTPNPFHYPNLNTAVMIAGKCGVSQSSAIDEGIYYDFGCEGLKKGIQYELSYRYRTTNKLDHFTISLTNDLSPSTQTNYYQDQCDGTGWHNAPSVQKQIILDQNNVDHHPWSNKVVRFTPGKDYSQLWFMPSNNDTKDKQDIWITNVSIARVCTPEKRYQNETPLAYTKTGVLIAAGESVDPTKTTGPVVVPTATEVDFRAGEEIYLGPGFSTETGSYFTAMLEPCFSDANQDGIQEATISASIIPNCGYQLTVDFPECEDPHNQATYEWSWGLGTTPSVTVAPVTETLYKVDISVPGGKQYTASVVLNPAFEHPIYANHASTCLTVIQPAWCDQPGISAIWKRNGEVIYSPSSFEINGHESADFEVTLTDEVTGYRATYDYHQDAVREGLITQGHCSTTSSVTLCPGSSIRWIDESGNVVSTTNQLTYPGNTPQTFILEVTDAQGNVTSTLYEPALYPYGGDFHFNYIRYASPQNPFCLRDNGNQTFAFGFSEYQFTVRTMSGQQVYRESGVAGPNGFAEGDICWDAHYDNGNQALSGTHYFDLIFSNCEHEDYVHADFIEVFNSYKTAPSLITGLGTSVNASKAPLVEVDGYITFDHDFEQLQIIGADGRLVRQVSRSRKITINDLPPGFYVLKGQQANQISNWKFLKQ